MKKGSIELLILSLLEAKSRHGYELGKLIESRSGGRLVFQIPSLYPLPHGGPWLDQRALGREEGAA
jgi:DNA-binding PadR family transcriptional regulator